MAALMDDHWVGSKVDNLADKWVSMMVALLVWCWVARLDDYWVELKAV